MKLLSLIERVATWVFDEIKRATYFGRSLFPMSNTTIEMDHGQIDMTPYYMAQLSRDLFLAANSYIPDRECRLPWYKFFLYCVSIELGLKASLLNNNNTPARKKGNRGISHNLFELVEEAASVLPADFFDAEDKEAINLISPFFKSKGLEYPSGELFGQMVTGAKGLPPIEVLEKVGQKVSDYLEEERCFTRSNTPT